MAGSVNEWREVDSVYLDLPKAFGNVSCTIVISKLMEVETGQMDSEMD